MASHFLNLSIFLYVFVLYVLSKRQHSAYEYEFDLMDTKPEIHKSTVLHRRQIKMPLSSAWPVNLLLQRRLDP